MDKVYRRISSTPVALCFELKIEDIVFPNLESEIFEDCLVTFNRTGQFENYTAPYPVVKGAPEGRIKVESPNPAMVNFEGERLFIDSTLYMSKGEYLPKPAEIGVFLKKKGTEKYTRGGKIKLELNKFGSGKKMELNALFSHKSAGQNIEISKAVLKFSLTAMSKEQADKIKTEVPKPLENPQEETETIASDESEIVPDLSEGREARSVINEDDDSEASRENSNIFCYIIC